MYTYMVENSAFHFVNLCWKIETLGVYWRVKQQITVLRVIRENTLFYTSVKEKCIIYLHVVPVLDYAAPDYGYAMQSWEKMPYL